MQKIGETTKRRIRNRHKNLRLINCYDIFNLSADKENVKKMILSEPVTDSITEELDLKGKIFCC